MKLLDSVVVFRFIVLVGVLEGLISFILTQNDGEQEGEGVNEEKDPEGNDFNKKPLPSCHLHLCAILTCFTETGGHSNDDDNHSENSVPKEEVINPHQVYANTDHSQCERCFNPFNHMKDS